MRFDFSRLSVKDVNAAAVRLPTRNTRREALIGVRDTGVMLFFEFVLDSIGSGVAAEPELFDELLALFVGTQTLPCGALFIRNDVSDVLVQPLAIRRLQLFAQLFFALSLLPFGERLGDGLASLGIGVRTFVLFLCITEVNGEE